MIVVVIVIPIVLSLPSMLFPIPPLMILVPTTLPFGVQVSPPFISFAAMLAPFLDRSVQSGFRFFDGVLALLSGVGVHEGCCHK